MATDFFQRQAVARRNTSWLVAMFVLAVVAIVGATVAATAVAVTYRREYRQGIQAEREWYDEGNADQWRLPLLAGGGALVLIVGGSLFKMLELSAGGTAVAERLGGRRVYPNSEDPTERRVLNVVEEMALASGVPVPPVFLLGQERGINAFAAGSSPSDAVVAVTRGCAEQLSRDELQGVIAHEFSHILNGDMRLNLRLIGVLHGILLFGLVGKMLLRIAYYSGDGGRYRSDSRRASNGVLYLFAVGLALLILGSLGSFFGNLIKAAVSRQREFLADASAVQFTRNPGGIAGALKRIGAAIVGSRLVAPAAAEASHMYFSQGVWEGFTGLFATHPPLVQRIHRIDPEWDGTYPPPTAEDMVADLATGDAAGLVAAGMRELKERPPIAVVSRAADQVANPTTAHRQYIASLIASLPTEITSAARDGYGARALIYAMLLDRDADVRANQLQALREKAEANVFELTLRLVTFVNRLNVRARLPLVDMSLSALRSLSPTQYKQFRNCFDALVHADHRISLFEWVLHQMLLRHLRLQFEPVREPQTMFYGLQRLGEPVSVLLSAVARASQGADEAAFDAAAKIVPEVAVQMRPPEGSGLRKLNDALQQLVQVAPQHRRRLVDACAAAICADGQVNATEAELLRGVCDLLGCPLPPLIDVHPQTPKVG